MYTMYLLNWDPDDVNTDTYGSQINYNPNGSVSYNNILQPAGKRIHWWITNSVNPNGSGYLPSLDFRYHYFLKFVGEVFPANSIGLKVLGFDNNGDVVNQKLTLDNQLKFKLDDNVKNFEIDLVKFNNESLIFKSIFLISNFLQEKVVIDDHLSLGFIDFVPKGSLPDSKVEIILKTYKRGVDSISLSLNQLQHPVRVLLINQDYQLNHLKSLISKFKSQYVDSDICIKASDYKSQIILKSIIK